VTNRPVPPHQSSIPWDQLENVILAAPWNGSYALAFVTRNRTVQSYVPSGPNKPDGRLAQLAATILSYRDRIRAGDAEWEPGRFSAR
jgi:hypothetical protein